MRCQVADIVQRPRIQPETGIAFRFGNGFGPVGRRRGQVVPEPFDRQQVGDRQENSRARPDLCRYDTDDLQVAARIFPLTVHFAPDDHVKRIAGPGRQVLRQRIRNPDLTGRYGRATYQRVACRGRDQRHGTFQLAAGLVAHRIGRGIDGTRRGDDKADILPHAKRGKERRIMRPGPNGQDLSVRGVLDQPAHHRSDNTVLKRQNDQQRAQHARQRRDETQRGLPVMAQLPQGKGDRNAHHHATRAAARPLVEKIE